MRALIASEFPEDPLLVLRAGWQFLVVYYIVATVIVAFLWRSLRASRFVHKTKPRVITAALLAAVYTPGEVSDFFLFNLPGPAVAGLGLLLIGLAFAAPSNPSALLSPSLWGMIAGYYLLPFVLVFVIFYAALFVYSCIHREATLNA
jgi:hypothetical protein